MPKLAMLFADGVNMKPGHRLGQADEHAADERAAHRAEPAGDDDDEGKQGVGGPSPA